jgi:hypothetical protein
MPTNYKILAQATSATADTSLYTVPADTETVVSTLAICNRGTVSATYKIATRIDGTATDDQHFLAFNASVPANDTIALTLGVTLDASDQISASASNTNLTFQVFGAEITA